MCKQKVRRCTLVLGKVYVLLLLHHHNLSKREHFFPKQHGTLSQINFPEKCINNKKFYPSYQLALMPKFQDSPSKARFRDWICYQHDEMWYSHVAQNETVWPTVLAGMPLGFGYLHSSIAFSYQWLSNFVLLTNKYYIWKKKEWRLKLFFTKRKKKHLSIASFVKPI